MKLTKEQIDQVTPAAQTAGADNTDAFWQDVADEYDRMWESGADLVKPKEKKHS